MGLALPGNHGGRHRGRAVPPDAPARLRARARRRRRVVRRDAGALLRRAPSRLRGQGGGDRLGSVPHEPGARLRRRRPQRDRTGPGLPRRRLLRRPAARRRPRDRARTRPHHVPLGRDDEEEVRPPPPRRAAGRRPHLRSGVVPAAPGGEVHRPLRRQFVPPHLRRDGRLRPRKAGRREPRGGVRAREGARARRRPRRRLALPAAAVRSARGRAPRRRQGRVGLPARRPFRPRFVPHPHRRTLGRPRSLPPARTVAPSGRDRPRPHARLRGAGADAAAGRPHRPRRRLRRRHAARLRGAPPPGARRHRHRPLGAPRRAHAPRRAQRHAGRRGRGAFRRSRRRLRLRDPLRIAPGDAPARPRAGGAAARCSGRDRLLPQLRDVENPRGAALRRAHAGHEAPPLPLVRHPQHPPLHGEGLPRAVPGQGDRSRGDAPPFDAGPLENPQPPRSKEPRLVARHRQDPSRRLRRHPRQP